MDSVIIPQNDESILNKGNFDALKTERINRSRQLSLVPIAL